MKSKTIIRVSLTIVFIIILVLVVKRIFTNGSEEKNTTEAPRMAGRTIPVNIQVISPRPLEKNIQTIGTILSNEEVELKSEISGKVVKINFSEGTFVKKGTLLVKINDADLQAQLKKIELKRQLAADKEFRQKKLLEKNGTSQELYDTALNELNSLIAEIEAIKAQIDKTEIIAPFNGIIGLRYISEGSYITPSTKIASLQNNNPVKIDFSIPQKYFDLVKVGENISFKVSSTGKTYNAKIYAIEPKIDESTRTLQVRATCLNSRNELMPGSFVEININLENLKDAITIPSQALVLDIAGEKVFLYKNGIALQIKVESGLRNEDEVQIVRGLQKGDTIITSGILQLRPKSKVKIVQSN